MKINVLKISGKLQTLKNKEKIMEQIADHILSTWNGTKWVVFLSGAAVHGAKSMGYSYEEYTKQKAKLTKEKRIDFQQNCASVGQTILFKEFSKFYVRAASKKSKLKGTAQILFDYVHIHGNKKDNLKNRINSLLNLDVMPILNNNDPLYDFETPMDNDWPASIISVHIGAKQLIMLTEEEGFYFDYKHKSGFAKKIKSSEVEKCLNSCGASTGNGGMEVKIKAGLFASEHGIKTIVSSYKNNLKEIMSGKAKSTEFVHENMYKKSKKFLRKL